MLKKHSCVCFVELNPRMEHVSQARKKCFKMLGDYGLNLEAWEIGHAKIDFVMWREELVGIMGDFKIAPAVLVDWDTTQQPGCFCSEADGLQWLPTDDYMHCIREAKSKMMFAVLCTVWIESNQHPNLKHPNKKGV